MRRSDGHVRPERQVGRVAGRAVRADPRLSLWGSVGVKRKKRKAS